MPVRPGAAMGPPNTPYLGARAPSGMPPMQRLIPLLCLVVVAASSSGCSIVDRLFLLNADGPYAQQAGMRGGRGCGDGCVDGACADCESGVCPTGGCESGVCPTGGCRSNRCNDCADGSCHGRHVGRYGGLAKHHLTPEEKMALECSDYGATQPAGPPSGAVAYPYYTTRGPRDFLAKCPPSIGP